RITGINAGTLNSNITFSGIHQLTGGPGADTLIGPDTDDKWTFQLADTGWNNEVGFSGFENLMGGTKNDTFYFGCELLGNGDGNPLHEVGRFTGTIDGGGGTNALDLNIFFPYEITQQNLQNASVKFTAPSGISGAVVVGAFSNIKIATSNGHFSGL